MTTEFSSPLDFEHDVVAVMDRAGFIRFITPPKKSNGSARKPEDVVGHHLSEFVHPDDMRNFDKWLGPDPRSSGTGESHIMFRVRAPGGSWRWLEATRPSLDGHRVTDHVIFFLRDIAAHRLMEHQYRLAEQTAGYGVWSLQRDNPHARLSAGMVGLFGFDPGDPETEKKFWPLALIDRKDVRRILKVLRGAFDTPRKFSFTCAIRTKDGSRRILKTTGHVRHDAAGIDAIFGVSQDVTKIDMAESHLRASEEQYRLLTQRASDIICRLAPDGSIEFISPSVLRLTGRRPGTLVGLGFKTLLPDKEHRRFAEFLARLRQGNEDILCTVRFKRLDRDDGWLEISGRTLREGTDKVYGLVCAARDISERKEFEFELEKARRHAEEVSESKSRFLAHISHELRTPLNAIMGFSELIRDGSPGPDSEARSAEYAGLIHESGRILTSLINDLLDLAKIEAGKYELNPEPVALREVVPFCVEQIRPEATRKQISVHDEVAGTELSVVADKRALTQILTNLLSNAVKFTKEGGRVTVSAIPGPELVQLCVEDTGIGIRAEDIERITAPFEQIKEASEISLKGTGLGLAIVKSLAELHGGTLTIKSKPGIGTRAMVGLPAVDRSHRRAA